MAVDVARIGDEEKAALRFLEIQSSPTGLIDIWFQVGQCAEEWKVFGPEGGEGATAITKLTLGRFDSRTKLIDGEDSLLLLGRIPEIFFAFTNEFKKGKKGGVSASESRGHLAISDIGSANRFFGARVGISLRVEGSEDCAGSRFMPFLYASSECFSFGWTLEDLDKRLGLLDLLAITLDVLVATLGQDFRVFGMGTGYQEHPEQRIE
jgi:hypothetical protein